MPNLVSASKAISVVIEEEALQLFHSRPLSIGVTYAGSTNKTNPFVDDSEWMCRLVAGAWSLKTEIRTSS